MPLLLSFPLLLRRRLLHLHLHLHRRLLHLHLHLHRPHSRAHIPRNARYFSIATPSSSFSSSLLPLSFPAFQIWASNTSLGKTLVSTGLAFSAVSSRPSPTRFLYLKPVQTGFPADSDSFFLFRKLSSLSLLHPPPFPLHISHHVLKTSLPAAQSLLPDATDGLKIDAGGLVELGLYEERLVGDRVGRNGREVVCITGWGWKESVSPDLAAKREGGAIEDGEVLQMLRSCLWNECDNKEEEAFCVVETAGGVASPGPSGTLQCDLYRQGHHVSLVLDSIWFCFGRPCKMINSDGDSMRILFFNL